MWLFIETLLRYLMGDGSTTRQQQLKNFSLPVSVENETKSWSFLETRAQLLLKAYTTTIQVNFVLKLNLLSQSEENYNLLFFHL